MQPTKKSLTKLLSISFVFLWFIFFLLIPLIIIVIYSFSTKGPYGGVLFHWTLESYWRATHWIYLKVLWNSFKLASLTALSCLFIGYPMAYVMATATALRNSLLILVVIPFWTNFVVRAYAIKVLFHQHSWIQHTFFTPSSDFLVWFGMVTNYLPFMILPLYVSLENFNFSLIEAAKDLGAPQWKILWKILFPLTRNGIISGFIFVFTPALGEFIIPDLLGGAKTLLVGNMITEQFLKIRDWPFGSCLSILLIFLVMFTLWIYLQNDYRHHD